ncbi:MAG: ABC transporter permease, partial [Pseudomonadota bacterium]
VDGSGEAVNLFAAILIPSGFGAAGAEDEEPAAAQYWSRNLTDTDLRDAIFAALNTALRRAKIAEYGLSEAVLDDIRDTDAVVGSFRPDREEADAELGIRDSIERFMPGILTYMLVVIIFGVGNLLLTNTIEERSNKIIEVLLASVTADELMLGKLIGIGAVGLTLPSVFLIGGGLATLLASSNSEITASLLDALFGSPILIIYLFYFFCAYAIFAMIFLAIGAISNSLQDAQSYMGPVTLLVFAPLPFVMMMYENPNGLIASILTWIPIYTPYAVLMRAAADPPLWEIVGATALMLVFAYFLARVMGRIFRRAILQAAPPKAKDVLKLAVARGD